MKKDFDRLPTVKRFLDKTKTSEDGGNQFQGIKTKLFNRALNSASWNKEILLQKVMNAMTDRLEDGESEIYKISSLVLNTEAQVSGKGDDEYLDLEIERLHELLLEPLKRVGVKSNCHLLEQWPTLHLLD